MQLRPYLHKVQFYETDGMSIVHHGHHILWMEEARTDFMDQIGWGYQKAVEAGIDFALTDVSCRYRSMTRFGEEVAITLTINHLSPAKLELGYRMTDAATGALRAEGSSYLPIDKIVMQDTGLIGQCQDQQILVGNSDFMSRQGIALPPGIKAKDAVFCAVDRELVGMFVLRYTLHPSILPSLQTMIAHRISPVMATRDFNLTPHRLRLWGRLSVDQITFPDLQRRVVLSGPRQIHGTTLVAVLCREGVAPFSQALVASQRIRRAAAFSQWFVHIGACVGVVITAALSSAGALTAMSPWNLSLFLLLWFVPVLMLSLWTTQY